MMAWTHMRIMVDPYKLIRVGPNEAVNGDPLVPVQKELENIKYVKVPGLPTFTGLLLLCTHASSSRLYAVNIRWCCRLCWL